MCTLRNGRHLPTINDRIAFDVNEKCERRRKWDMRRSRETAMGHQRQWQPIKVHVKQTNIGLLGERQRERKREVSESQNDAMSTTQNIYE